MIINIRGTHGSGKSTVIKQLLKLYDAEPEYHADGKKIRGYRFTLGSVPRDVYVAGSYATACGGCDGIQPYADIWPRIVEYAAKGHVLFEGALVSSSYGNIGRASEAYGDQMVFAFLNTPLQMCLERIVRRREA